MGSSWSAPGWMKQPKADALTNYEKGCYLKGDPDHPDNNSIATYEGYLADYLLKTVQAYSNEGLPISLLSLQNEPDACNYASPGMFLSVTRAKNVATLLRAKLNGDPNANVKATKLLAWDHSWDQWVYTDPADSSKGYYAPATYPKQVMGCKPGATGAGTSTPTFVGVGYHGYAGDGGALENEATKVQDQFVADCGNKDIYLTEMTSTTNTSDIREHLWYWLHNQFFRPIRHGAKGGLYWNLALDPSYGPRFNSSVCANCTGLITVDNQNNTYTKNPHFYFYAHFSKFIGKDAVRIDSNEPPLTSNGKTYPLETAAFKNLDGTIVLVAMNQRYAE